METNGILETIDEQITQLQQARALLAGNESTGASTGKRRGRPKGFGGWIRLPADVVPCLG